MRIRLATKLLYNQLMKKLNLQFNRSRLKLRKITDFKTHIELHRTRVLRLGMALGKKEFPEINPRILESFLKLHDSSKTLSAPKQLNSFGYTHSRPPLERLFEFYGKKAKTSDQNLQLQSVINDINSIDDQMGQRYLAPLGLDSASIRNIYIIEKIADLVDRSLDPLAQEEFGHQMVLASEYLQDPYLSSLSMWLEEHYRQITVNLNFPSYRKAE